jgi:hypothetical protein
VVRIDIHNHELTSLSRVRRNDIPHKRCQRDEHSFFLPFDPNHKVEIFEALRWVRQESSARLVCLAGATVSSVFAFNCCCVCCSVSNVKQVLVELREHGRWQADARISQRQKGRAVSALVVLVVLSDRCGISRVFYAKPECGVA